VIVPAYNDAAVIKRTLAALSRAAVDGFIESIRVHDDIMLVESGGTLGYGGGMNAGAIDRTLRRRPDAQS
jgi:GT2 family glycosyltransferase